MAGDLPGVEVHAGEQGLVVEHLLEVGDQPLAVDRVAGETPAEVVVDPARTPWRRATSRPRPARRVPRRRPRRRRLRRRRSSPPQRRRPGERADEGVQAHRLGELGRAAEAPVGGVVLGPQVAPRRGQRLGSRRLLPGLQQRGATEGTAELTRLRVDVGAAGAPQLVDAAAQLGEADHAAAPGVGEVRAAEERPAVRREEHRHRPAALARSWPAPPPCRSRRRRGAPRGRP